MNRLILLLTSALILMAPLMPAQAAVVSSQASFQTEVLNYDRQMLLSSLNNSAVKAKLQSLGVSMELAEQRIGSMTAMEIATLNQKLDELPAAAGIVGIAVTVLVVIVVLDLLGITDVFSFIHPIN